MFINRKDYKALVVDLDGTLIGRYEQVSPRVAKAVSKVAKQIYVSISSGRETSDVLRFACNLGLTAPQVADNGALILDPISGRPLWSAPPLGAVHAREIVNRLRTLEANFIATHPGGTLTEADEMADREFIRVSALDMEGEAADEMVTYFRSNPNLHVVKVALPYNGMWAVDFTQAGVHKALATRCLAQMLDIDTAWMIAAGDSYNDLPLFEACGLRIAMGDAPEDLKVIADYVAPSVDDDGLAVAIEEFILPRL